MKRALLFLLAFLALDVWALATLLGTSHSSSFESLMPALFSSIAGGIGGVTYCLRGIYLNFCVCDSWDSKWIPWYFIRPLVSHICGAASYVFLQAGMLILESESKGGRFQLGFIALAFIAGLNADKFLGKIEDIARSAWGIEPSRTARSDKESDT